MEEKQLDTWFEETKEIPVKVFDEYGNEHITTREVKEKVLYTQLKPQSMCSKNDHDFELVEGGKRINGRVLVKCKNCTIGSQIIVGVTTLENGKIVPYTD